MKRILFSLLALVGMTLTASAGAPTYSLTKADGAEAHGTITFYVGTNLTNPATVAYEGATVTVVIAPTDGWVVNTDKVEGLWGAIEAKARPRRTLAGIAMEKDITLTYVSTDETTNAVTYTFEMIRAKAEISCAYKKLMTNADITVDDIDEQTYTGQPLKPEVTVKDNGTPLTLNTDYTVSYGTNQNAGTGVVTITGIGDNYAGTTTKEFKVNKAESYVVFNPWDISKTFGDEDFTITPEVNGDGELKYESQDESVAKVDPATGLVTITGVGRVWIYATISATNNYLSYSNYYVLTVNPKEIEYENGDVTQDEDGYTVNMTEDENNPYADPLPDDADLSNLTYERDLTAPGDGSGDVIIDEQPANLFTVCLPFEPKKDAAVKYYTLTSVVDETLNFDEVADAQSHTPYLVAVFGDVNVTEDCSDLDISSMTINTTTVDGYTFNGTFYGKKNADALGLYILQSGNRWGKVTSGSVYIPPFRAYIEATSAGARMTLNSNIGDNTTGIQNIRTVDCNGTERWFDLNGRRIEKPATKGVYIQDGRKVVVK